MKKIYLNSARMLFSSLLFSSLLFSSLLFSSCDVNDFEKKAVGASKEDITYDNIPFDKTCILMEKFGEGFCQALKSTAFRTLIQIPAVQHFIKDSEVLCQSVNDLHIISWQKIDVKRIIFEKLKAYGKKFIRFRNEIM